MMARTRREPADSATELARFRATFDRRGEDDRRELRRLSDWAEALWREGVCELRFTEGPKRVARNLGLVPHDGKGALVTVANDDTGESHVYLYPYSRPLQQRAPKAFPKLNAATSGLKELSAEHVTKDVLEAYAAALREASGGVRAARPRSRPTMKTPYTPARRESSTPLREPFEVDPNEIDRATARHMELQDALAQVVKGNGLQALKPGEHDPDFDVAWWEGDVAVIAEVKTTNPRNESRQLRLGLGQVLDYGDLLRAHGYPAVRAVLVVETAPSDERWTRLCGEHGVQLVWPETFSSLFRAP
jgi:hypothetical protein